MSDPTTDNRSAVPAAREPASVGSRRWRMLLPLLFVLVTVGGLAVVLIHSHYANRSAVVKLSQDVLDSVDGRVLTEVESFLGTASRMAELIARIAREGDELSIENRDLLDRTAIDVLRTNEPLAMFNIADTTGQFLMPKKMPDGSIDTKVIRIRDGERRVSWIRRDPAGNVEGEETVTGDNYDPRQRPWYQGAVATGKLFWTDVYIFFTARNPGVTAAAPVYDSDGKLLGVLGLDIELDTLSAFLGRLKIGSSGQAVIVADDGTLVAHPDLSKTMREADGQLKPANVTEIGQPVLQRAYNLYRLQGSGHYSELVNGERYIISANRLPPETGQDWAVLTVVPESDFVGIVAANSRRSLQWALAMALVASAVGIAAYVQTVRTGRAAARAIDRQHQLEAEAAALVDLACGTASAAGVQEPGGAAALDLAAQLAGVPRASIWRLDASRHTAVIQWVHEGGQTQPGGLSFAWESVERLAELVRAGQLIAVRDVRRDEATAGLADQYLAQTNVRSMLLAPIRTDDDASRLLVLEQTGRPSRWSEEQMQLAERMARMIAAQQPAERRAPPAAAPSPAAAESAPDPAAAQPADPRREAVRAALRAEADAPGTAARRSFSRAVVLVALIDRADAPSRRGGPADSDAGLAADRLCRAAADAYRADALLAMAEGYVAVFDTAGGEDDAVGRAVEMGLCLTEESGEEPAIRPRVGAALGALTIERLGNGTGAERAFGDAARRARTLAATAPSGGVQVGPAIRQRLGDGYFCQPRGRFLTDDLGDLEVAIVRGASA